MKIKDGVKLDKLTPQLVLAIAIAGQVYLDVVKKEMVITSISDGKHMKGSKHYIGNGVDTRIRDLTPLEQANVLVGLKTSLGLNYDVVLEIDHFHIEYDPK